MTSINSGISREDDDTWELLKENKVIVPESIKKILNDLNFSGIRALAKVNESSVMIEEYIRDVLGDPDVLEIMNKEEKPEKNYKYLDLSFHGARPSSNFHRGTKLHSKFCQRFAKKLSSVGQLSVK
ncbi:hypothetical protein DAPPUDRAFT_117946 [Daphnia pulex]|uniref:Uncharacterized protein n=1 Tax=Daphnia pulex TaxID=6669 RepID=E9HU80_DAPPU|nr:hypothetical protein DAPPUDRAFT_117946 [Daphnia pulex]|eukprot:EFX64698.1 hypothetical protein DAPPUDRAFT_117946 [Daphnia pulex]